MSKKRHIRRFDGGRSTPQEYHAMHAFPVGTRCAGCGGRPSIRALVMVPSDDAERSGMIPVGAGVAPHLFPQLAPVLVRLKDGGSDRWFIRISKTYSCTLCQAALERTLAKAPSWAVVDISRGPDPHNRVQVGAS
jgi:hypothetical protein